MISTPAVSCSVGIAVHPLDAGDVASMLVAAQHACYVAKRRGRDQIATATAGLTLAGAAADPG